MDGKPRAARGTDTQAAVHLLAAVTGTGHTVTQLRVPTKTNEVTGFARLLAPTANAGTGGATPAPPAC
ncbi:hypothetical protein [Streptomyces sp. NPDC047718]|uniref:hypothetical protein n=1 Tax=Streptomyces sp. NPDC047718 TaxID=3155479 RepID=UPI0033D0BDC8